MSAMPYIGVYLKRARQRRGLTQEEAATMLPLDIRTLQRYERDEASCPDDVVPEIARAYGDSALPLEALQAQRTWREVLPALGTRTLGEAVLALYDDVAALGAMTRQMLRVARAGCVQEDVQQDWACLREGTLSVIQSGLELLASVREGGKHLD